MGGEDGADSTSKQSKESDAKESSPQHDVNQSSGKGNGNGEEGASDDTVNKADVGSGTGPKLVQWSSFNSEVNAQKSSSYSDFFNEFGDNSDDPFAATGSKGNVAADQYNGTHDVSGNSAAGLSSSNHLQNHEGHNSFSGSGQCTDSQDLSNSQYWENLYPGWKYDHSTGQWYQLEGYDANATANATASNGIGLNQNSDSYYSQQTDLSSGVSSWNQNPNGHIEYPAHMVFDPQYPGWYYDTIAQEWRTLDHSTNVDYNQQYQDVNFENHGSQGSDSQTNGTSLGESKSQFGQQNMNMWRMGSVSENGRAFPSESRQLQQPFHSVGHLDNLAKQHERHIADSSNKLFRCQSFNPTQQHFQHYNQSSIASNQQMQHQSAYFETQKSFNYYHDSFQSGTQFNSETKDQASAGRPPHALVTFGFGGKLIVMKNNTSSPTSSANGSQDSLGCVFNVLNLMELVMENNGASCLGSDAHDYFLSLCQQSFPGPLVGGNVGNKEVNKWIDERIANFESLDIDQRKREPLMLLISVLKISCQYYGKLRSPFGTDETLKESDYPEAALAKLFRSVKGNWVESGEYGALQYCMQNLPSAAHMQATALEVQRLLVSGRKIEAFQCAEAGQLWGPALVLASQLGDQFFGEAVKQMAVKQLMAGSPLRTLCLLIAGQPADVFSLPGYVDSSHYHQQPAQFGTYMLDDWEENLAVITANRTKDDELVIIHLGDTLWKERSEIIAAHICYLVAEASIEPYSDSSRLCLLGADHWTFPRTYASPAAIQRTEVYEYSKLLGNPQFLLLPFQPYKLIYACMLAEVGKIVDSLKYCQAILKTLKTGRAPEVDIWRQIVSSLEERLRIHQQGGYSSNLASTKLVGKFLSFFDSTANRVVGGLRPPAPSTSGHHVTTSTPSLMPSASMEPIREWSDQNNRSTMPSRSRSEPDFGSRSPRKVNIPSETKTPEKQEKTEASSGSSRFGRFGSQLFQKTVGLVLRSRSNRQAKLGEKNKFYYDEKLKRWVEEGVDPPAEESTLPPPPTTSALQDGKPDFSNRDVSTPEISSGFDRNTGIPPMPPSSTQFSARARMGVRSRYVDTFNKSGVGGTPANLFQSPSMKPAAAGGSNPKIFIPARVTQTDEVGEKQQESFSTPYSNVSSPRMVSPKPAISSMQRYPSMNCISQKQAGVAGESGSRPSHPHRRTVSWSGDIALGSPRERATRPLAEVMGPSFFSPPQMHQHGSDEPDLGDDLHQLTL